MGAARLDVSRQLLQKLEAVIPASKTQGAPPRS
jgi:hypothetical protein